MDITNVSYSDRAAICQIRKTLLQSTVGLFLGIDALVVTRCTMPDEDRLSPSPPATGLYIEAPWKPRIAKPAAAAFIQIPTSKLIPIAFDKHLTARCAIG